MGILVGILAIITKAPVWIVMFEGFPVDPEECVVVKSIMEPNRRKQRFRRSEKKPGRKKLIQNVPKTIGYQAYRSISSILRHGIGVAINNFWMFHRTTNCELISFSFLMLTQSLLYGR